MWQLIVPGCLREKMLAAIHTGLTGVHICRRRTELQIQRRAYWHGWTTDIRSLIKKCTASSRCHRGRVPRTTALKPMVAGDTWERVSIDITGRFPRSRRGNQFILSIVGHFPKWRDAFPLPNQNAIAVSRTLLERVNSIFGPPMQLLSDGEPEFEGIVMRCMCKWLTRSSPQW